VSEVIPLKKNIYIFHLKFKKILSKNKNLFQDPFLAGNKELEKIIIKFLKYFSNNKINLITILE
jgi:hypothetical protein